MMNLKSYFSVKDIFYTIQGEGANAGRAAVFVRFAGCNGWSGREQDRAKGPFPCSKWCDTDFVGGRRMHEDDLVDSIMELFPRDTGWPMIVFTGGEPALQLTDSLLGQLLPHFPMIAIETNGSLPLPSKAALRCWITVSPKTEKVLQTRASELKLIHPTIDPAKFSGIKAPWRFLQPLHNADWQKNTAATVAYVKAHPEWRLSLQTHKYIGIE
jgi:7-carboxy-7-deazaguanine synthase